MTGKTDITINIPNGNTLAVSESDWTSFLNSVQEYAGEQFMSGPEGDRALYERLLRASGVELSHQTA